MNSWHYNIYKHDKYTVWEFESKKSLFFSNFSFYEQLKLK